MSIQAHKRAGLVSSKAAGAPGEEQLAAINRYTLDDVTGEQVYVRTAYLAHNAIDRDREAFADALLADFARTLPGKGLFIKHPSGWDGDSGPGIGRWFETDIVEMSQAEARSALGQPDLQWPPGVERARLLEASFYVPRTAKNEDLIADINAGVAGDVSIGFRASKRAPIENDGEYAGAVLFGPGEALEGSLVWLGAQPGARVTKAAGKNDGEKTVELEQLKSQIKTLEGEKTALQQNADENAAKAKAFDSLKNAVGDIADEPDQLKAVIAEGKAYRKSLIDEVVTARRHLKMTGDTPDDVVQAEKFYAGMPIDMLKAEKETLCKQVPAGSQLEGSDPNISGADGNDAGGLRDASKTRKAAGLDK